MANNGWHDVKHLPGKRCPICGKPDWCTFNERGVCCMRVPGGHFRMRNGGWFYSFDSNYQPVQPVTTYTEPQLEYGPDYWTEMFYTALKQTTRPMLTRLAKLLGISPKTFERFPAAWSQLKSAWMFPMYNARHEMIGIRLRTESGAKFAVKHSRQGLFLALDAPGQSKTILVCEGPTSTLAGLELGYYTVGLPSAGQGFNHLAQFVLNHKIKEVILCLDNKLRIDGQPDIALKLNVEKARQTLNCAVRYIVLPTKDLRDFVSRGGTRELFDSLLDNQCARVPKRVRDDIIETVAAIYENDRGTVQGVPGATRTSHT